MSRNWIDRKSRIVWLGATYKTGILKFEANVRC